MEYLPLKSILSAPLPHDAILLKITLLGIPFFPLSVFGATEIHLFIFLGISLQWIKVC